jgi:hypothetical protein
MIIHFGLAACISCVRLVIGEASMVHIYVIEGDLCW